MCPCIIAPLFLFLSHAACSFLVEGWAGKHNLKLNYKKSGEMPFVRPKCNRHIDVPPPAVKGINRVQHITALGDTLSHNFSMTKHIDTVMAAVHVLSTVFEHYGLMVCLRPVCR